MKIVKVESSAVLNVGYDGDALFVQFVGGEWYKYRHVSETVFDELCKAESVGQFVNEHIKPVYKDVDRLKVSPVE